MSDEAKRLYREEPNLFEAANKEFKGNYGTSILIVFPLYQSYGTILNCNHPFVELPADAWLHDLAFLSVIDSKNLDPEQLGIDAIKEQQATNLKHSSDKCAIIPEDRLTQC